MKKIPEGRVILVKPLQPEKAYSPIALVSVCEPCVDLAGAQVIVSKIKHEGMTLAIGILK